MLASICHSFHRRLLCIGITDAGCGLLLKLFVNRHQTSVGNGDFVDGSGFIRTKNDLLSVLVTDRRLQGNIVYQVISGKREFSPSRCNPVDRQAGKGMKARESDAIEKGSGKERQSTLMILVAMAWCFLYTAVFHY